jgi:hypothetical protein
LNQVPEVSALGRATQDARGGGGPPYETAQAGVWRGARRRTVIPYDVADTASHGAAHCAT